MGNPIKGLPNRRYADRYLICCVFKKGNILSKLNKAYKVRYHFIHKNDALYPSAHYV